MSTSVEGVLVCGSPVCMYLAASSVELDVLCVPVSSPGKEEAGVVLLAGS